MPSSLARRCAGAALALVLCAAGANAGEPPLDSEPSSSAQRSSWYMALSGFYVIPRDSDTTRPTGMGRLTSEIEYADSVAFSAAIGRHVTRNLRLELEVGYAPVDIEAMSNLRLGGRPVDVPYSLAGDSDVWTLMLSASYDFPTRGPLRPYVGAGLGVSHHESSTTFTLSGMAPVSDSDDDTVLGYHLRAGVGYEVSETVVVFAGYRYAGARDVEIGGTRSTSASDTLQAGVRIRL